MVMGDNRAVGAGDGEVEVVAIRGEMHIADILVELERDNLLPAIVFRTSRSQCDNDAERAAKNKRCLLPAREQRELGLKIREILKRYEMDLELVTTHPQYQSLILTAIGAHHAGQLLSWRLLLEELMAAGMLRILVATGTVAAGVDFPARTVVITADSKKGGEGFKKLTATEFQQMSGRAGRRGKDAVGFCVIAPSPYCDARQLLKISKRPAEPLGSAYFPSPSTVLNLLRYRNVDDLRFTVERSLASYVDRREGDSLRGQASALLDRMPPEVQRFMLSTAGESELEEHALFTKSHEQKRMLKKIKRLERQAVECKGRQLNLLEQAINGLRELGYIEGLSLSPKGFWAAHLCTNLVIELAEIIESGLLENASAEFLAAVVASIAGDSNRRYLESKHSVIEDEKLEKLRTIVKHVGEKELPGYNEKREVSEAAAYTVLLWMQAENWQQFRSLLILTQVAEGDAARLITQTSDHLNQITRLYDTHPQLAIRAEEAKRRILRPPLTEAINLESE